MAETILDGGPANQQNSYTGVPRELTADESNQELRLHDGVTPGGHRILNRDQNDSRYQGRNVELDGLGEFQPEERGFPVRRAPSEYRLRSIEFNDEQIYVLNPDGVDGNPYIGLQATISTDQVWTGQHLFTQVVQFDAGINADVSGDTTGTHNGPVIGDVTGDLTGDSTGTHTGPQVGNVDVRGHTIQFDNEQIPLSALNGLLEYVKANAEDIGSIKFWHGSVSDIPDGWHLCDGLSGTPDLRNVFILGAGAANPYPVVGQTGGSHEVTPAGTLNSAGAHTHTYDNTTANNTTGIHIGLVYLGVDSGDQNTNMLNGIDVDDPTHNHDYNGVTDSGGGHTHTFTGTQFDNRPAYYAMAIIMKVA